LQMKSIIRMYFRYNDHSIQVMLFQLIINFKIK